jgi:hypothetical protein
MGLEFQIRKERSTSEESPFAKSATNITNPVALSKLGRGIVIDAANSYEPAIHEPVIPLRVRMRRAARSASYASLSAGIAR